MDTRSSTKSDLAQQFESFRADIIQEIRNIVKEEVNNALTQQKELYTKKISILEDRISSLEDALESAEQYQRRLILRVDGVPTENNESTEVVFTKIENMIKEACPDISSSDIDRAHRIGPEYNDYTTKLKCRSIIVRFTSFKARTKVYRSRRKMKKVKVKLDLTKKRYITLMKAVEDANSNEKVNYVFADINCRLKVVFKDESENFSCSFDEYQEIVRMA